MIVPMAIAVTLASCSRGDGPALYPVYGKVTYQGEPAAGAFLTLVPDGPAAPGSPSVTLDAPPCATVQEDGGFSISCGVSGYGALPGRYKVLITWRTGLATDAAKVQAEATKKKRGRSPNFKPDKHEMLAPDRLGGRYADPAKSPLTALVKPETNNLPPFELK
jgi:hypothetical protein